MKIRSLHLNSDFGFIAMEEDDFVKSWFFFGKGQGRQILLPRITDLEEVRNANNNILCSVLPKDSITATVPIIGMAAAHLSRLIHSIAEISLHKPKIVLKGKITEPKVYFLLTPQLKGRVEMNGLLGCCDDEGSHTVYVFYSKRQGWDILQRSFHKTKEIRDSMEMSIEQSMLPGESDISSIPIGDPIAVFLNRGYAMLRQVGKMF